jgi:hypothetical protein
MTKKHRGVPWCSGPDPMHHRMYVQFGYNRVSARGRGEAWHLTWPQWRDIWLPHWHQRGRSADCLCLARQDMEGDWHVDNVELITRREHGRRVRRQYQ